MKQIMDMKKTMTLINAWDTMLDLILSFFGDKLEWNEETLRYLSSKEEFEYEEIQLMKPIYVDSEQTIDAILFFNDGTIEFHLTSCEAYNWTNYGIFIIKNVINQLMCLCKMAEKATEIEEIKGYFSYCNPKHRMSAIKNCGYEVRRCFVPEYRRIGGMCYMPKLKEYRYIIGSPRLHSPKEVYAVIFK